MVKSIVSGASPPSVMAVYNIYIYFTLITMLDIQLAFVNLLQYTQIGEFIGLYTTPHPTKSKRVNM